MEDRKDSEGSKEGRKTGTYIKEGRKERRKVGREARLYVMEEKKECRHGIVREGGTGGGKTNERE